MKRSLRALAGFLFAAASTIAQDGLEHPIRFQNVAPRAGLNFTVENHPTEHKHLIETMAGGVAAFDYDGDGLTDIFFTNGAAIPSLKKESPKYHNRLFRNLGGMRFQDVTQEAGVSGIGYAIGASSADYDNDGDADLFVGGVRRNILYRNNGDGTFEDVTSAAGIRSGLWCEGSAWFDFDRDGWLDLFVVNYLQWHLGFDTFCGDKAAGVRAYCHPRLFEGLPNTLYRNRGDGTFEDVSQAAGIADHVGKGMSVVVADYDLDGYLDLFVTNDKLANFLFHANGDGTFEEVALFAGGALQDSGMAVSSMGADFRDANNDGYPDIVFAALTGETFPIFINQGDGEFRDAGHATGMAPLSHDRSGWSIGLFDLDNDGWKDIFTTNSHVNDTVEFFEATKYTQTNSVFRNTRDGRFADASAGSGLDQGSPQAHRGCAFADFDQDGRIDIVTASLEGPAELWRNVSTGTSHWLNIRLVGATSNRDGIGARIVIGDQTNHMTTSVGYNSSSHSGVHFGLGATRLVELITIYWPSGKTQTLENVPADQALLVEEP